ncbi:MAG: carboxylating nicotinate-nucleotide diphosphorylase [Deltaproteobacteria bacterium]|nr:carboxylating nicotinate-nucleotide diphosphorylase [Deltaproteobacteria bacterium]MBW2020608.1 carboxylating nicotinate-nucleotide diphosphorylase [Deltaproteobacteria bacterium]MBW2075495.1 carboxylating nicotinate-nucleotide diphosphorylase [Deltaproteobacteria bacterium]RLB81562.1 MAG: carboxylating nicotinate-nucleotide diphosphorylase [Deltaproteobacteria bacterium]
MFNNEKLIRLALAEDIGPGDVTTDALIEPDRVARAVIFAKESLVLAGLQVAQEVFTTLDPAMRFETFFQDGDRIGTGDTILKASGKLHALLTGERTALNFLQRLSGIATLTRQYVDQVAGSHVRLTDTRKTLPGWRRLEKYAVKIGGAHNHRFGLYDGILIKDNHIAACGGISEAVARVRNHRPHLLRIEVEVSDLNQVKEALENGVDVIMLDNMDLDDIRKAVRLIDGRALVEVSGGMTLDTLAEVANTGVDIISIGALTHSARAVDISMKVAEG